MFANRPGLPKFPKPGTDIGIERWGMRSKQLGQLLGRWPEAVSRWASRRARMRMESEELREAYDTLDETLATEGRNR